MSQPLSPEIDGCYHLFLQRLWEPEENCLQVIIDEAVVEADEVIVEVSNVPKVAMAGRPIVVGPQSRAFRLSWPRYVAYSVANESFHVQGETDRIASGRLLVVYEASDYLNHVRRVTWDVGDAFGPVVHVGIFCLNHVIDVVGFGVPEIQPASPSSSE